MEQVNEYFKKKEEMLAVSGAEDILDSVETFPNSAVYDSQAIKAAAEPENSGLDSHIPDDSSTVKAGIPTVWQNPNKKLPCRGLVHVVKQGDTLYKIAGQHNLKVLDLLLANPYVNVYNLQIGDELCVPVKAVPYSDNQMTYEVKEGDTVNAILQKTGISLEKLLRLNPFLLDLALPENTIIYIPDNKM